jgi:uncharacterized protein YjiS (DUF1127 family)
MNALRLRSLHCKRELELVKNWLLKMRTRHYLADLSADGLTLGGISITGALGALSLDKN